MQYEIIRIDYLKLCVIYNRINNKSEDFFKGQFLSFTLKQIPLEISKHPFNITCNWKAAKKLKRFLCY